MKRTLVGLLAALLLLAAAPAAPAVADGGLLGGLGSDAAAGSSSDDAATWGTASAKDQVLRQGCRAYRFHYDVAAPGDSWMVQLTLVNPNGRKVANKSFQSDTDPAEATRTWQVCRTNTKPGKHVIRMVVTSYDGRDQADRKAAPTTFRLTRG